MHDRWQRMQGEYRRRIEEQALEHVHAHVRDHLDGHGRFHRRGRFRGAPLHVRLFWWFGFSILLMGAARSELAHAVAHTLTGSRLTLTDPAGRALLSTGVPCTAEEIARRFKPPAFKMPIVENGSLVGNVQLCFDDTHGHGGRTFLLALGSAGLTLWMASMAVARRIGRPLRDLTRVTRDIGGGNLKSRARLGRQPGELGTLAESINDMAERIEQQLADERELVAAVSHEIRAPLARLRILTEILRGKHVDGPTLDKLEREIVEIDSLVGDLLASSRLDFSLITFHSLDAAEIGREAVDRQGLPEGTLHVTATRPRFDGDATLLARALSNLLDNAARHAGGAVRMTVRDDGADAIVFEVDDKGSGFSPDVLPRAFQAFERGNAQRRGSTSLGLGLALVRRIAEAHGGAAWAENLPERGARVAIRLSRRRPEPSAPS
jgi:signal transduction histidine kinase